MFSVYHTNVKVVLLRTAGSCAIHLNCPMRKLSGTLSAMLIDVRRIVPAAGIHPAEPAQGFIGAGVEMLCDEFMA